MDGEETRIADDIGRYAVKATRQLLRPCDCDAKQMSIESLNAMLREQTAHHDRRECELQAKIRELRAEIHETQERCTEFALMLRKDR